MLSPKRHPPETAGKRTTSHTGERLVSNLPQAFPKVVVNELASTADQRSTHKTRGQRGYPS
jgi:hypothetical protein